MESLVTIPRPMKHQWFHILLALAERDMHGFGIQRAVLERTNGEVHLWPAMLYRSLRTLADEGLIQLTDWPEQEPEDERRQYYSLTGEGKARLNQEAELMAGWADAAKARLVDQGAG